MKIVILGKGKSGTTALFHMVAATFPECRPVLGGFRAHTRERARRNRNPNDSFACKFTYNEKKGRSFDAVMRHVADEGYEKKIWVARDPRDNAVSDALFRWRGRHGKSVGQYRACLPLVQRKERDPSAVPFHEIYRYTGDPGGPETPEELVAAEGARYRRMCEFVGSLGSDWFIFKYEDLVDQNFAELSAFLERKVRADAEIPRDDQVKARTKSYGDWRNWFVEEDIRIFEPIYTPYMDLVGYDSSDWSLNPNPTIDPALASEYMKRLSFDGRFVRLRCVRKRVGRLLDSATSSIGRHSS
jgi:hypothetical protein